MPPTENPATEIESALANGNFGLALRLADKLVATSKRSLLGWVSRARANLGLGRIDEREDIEEQVAGLQLSQQRELPQRDHVSPRRS